jgi:hypothetical protein
MVFDRVTEMIESGDSDRGAEAPSCYRLSVLSGSIEVTARLKTNADLELLIKVLEANKVLFTTNEGTSKSKNAAMEASSPSKKKSPNGKHPFEKRVDSENEILTLA